MEFLPFRAFPSPGAVPPLGGHMPSCRWPDRRGRWTPGANPWRPRQHRSRSRGASQQFATHCATRSRPATVPADRGRLQGVAPRSESVASPPAVRPGGEPDALMGFCHRRTTTASPRRGASAAAPPENPHPASGGRWSRRTAGPVAPGEPGAVGPEEPRVPSRPASRGRWPEGRRSRLPDEPGAVGPEGPRAPSRLTHPERPARRPPAPSRLVSPEPLGPKARDPFASGDRGPSVPEDGGSPHTRRALRL
jgi:hypothetical protein